MWVPTSDLPAPAAHPFYARLSRLFHEQGFDDTVEGLCAKFYARETGVFSTQACAFGCQATPNPGQYLASR